VRKHSRFRCPAPALVILSALLLSSGCSSTGGRRAGAPSPALMARAPLPRWEEQVRVRADSLLETAHREAASGRAAEALSCSDDALAAAFNPPAGHPLDPRFTQYAAELLEESAAVEDEIAARSAGSDARQPDDGLPGIVLQDVPDIVRELPPVSVPLPPSDLPLTINGPVQHYLSLISASNEYRSRIAKGLARAATYLPMIRSRLDEAGLPEDLAYLPLIESAFSPTARSRARALGMWQFISSTGRLYGLRISSLVDERCDPERSTAAAVAHLADLHAEFGDWYLALAAYNSGSGNVRRAIRRAHSTDFWKIRRYLPRETRNYVPAFIASVIVAKDPARFGLDPPPAAPWRFDTITVPDAVDLQFLAARLDIPLAELRELNPAIRRDLTPAARTTRLRLPPGTRARAEALLQSVPRSRWAPRLIHTVRRGDSLYTIARRYGSTVASIRRANRLRGNLIHPGQHLVVPRLRLARRHPARRRTVRTRPGDRVYTVQPNDTLWDIARSFGISVSRLRRANGLGRHTLIHPRQRLVIPRRSTRRKARRTVTARGGTNSYTVRSGDTLYDIARRFGTTVRALRHANGLRGSRIHPGDVLRIPGRQARG